MALVLAISIAFVTIVLTVLIFKRKAKWNYLFSEARRCRLKWIASYVYLKYFSRKSNYASRYGLKHLSPYELGLLPYNFEIDLEKPCVLIEHKEAFECVAFCGTDKNGNCFYVKVFRHHDRYSGIQFLLKVNGVGDFTFTQYPDTNFYNTDGKSFSGNGIRVEVLEPMRTWRISYNGILQTSTTEKEVHVKFVFIWTAISLPFDFKSDISECLYADYLVQRSFIDVLEHSSYDERFRQNRYEQWGQIAGTLNVEGHDEINVHLRGLRAHSFGLWDWNEVDELVDVQTYFHDGTAVHVGQVKHKRTNVYKFGWMIASDGSMHPVDQLEISGANNEKIQFSFCAGFKKFCLLAEVQDCPKKFLNGHRWQNKMTTKLVKCNVNGNVGYGLVRVSEHNLDEQCEFISSLPQLLPSKICATPRKLVTNIEDSHCRCIGAVGGKACSLAMLNKLEAEFSVPRAVCVTTYAYCNHLAEHSQTQTYIEELQNVLRKKKDGNVADLCKQIQSSFSEMTLNAETLTAIKEEMQNVFQEDIENLKFAVRSSAVDEDGDEMSVAGQNDTYLGIIGIDKVCTAIIQCWASQFTYHATEYKRQNGCLINPGMGVIIQEMIPATSAGVVFTNNPVTGNSNEIVINSNYGLGEGVVSSTVEPDTFVIQSIDDKLEIKDRKLGEKHLKVIMNDNGGTKEMQSPENEKEKYSLSDETVLKLAEMSKLIEKGFGNARDIEWAISNELIYFLQSRPITSSQFTEFELMHELDTSLKTDFEISTKANAGEVFTDASSPLTISTVARSMDFGIQMTMVDSHKTKLTPNPLAPVTFVFASNHVMLNCLDMMYRNIGGQESSITNIIELGIFGHILNDEDMYKKAYERHGYKKHSKFKVIYYMLKLVMVNEKILKTMSEMMEKINCSSSNKKCTTEELLSEITALFPYVVKFSDYHAGITAASTIWNLIAILALVGKKSEWNEDVYSDIACLLANCTDVVSADVPNALKELSKIIATVVEREKFATEFSVEEATEWLNKQPGQVGRKYKNFLEKHGHRCLKEFDLYSPSWRMNPADFVSVVQNMVKNQESIHGQKKVSNIKETIQQLKTEQSFLSKKMLSWILPRYRAAVACREKSKSVLIKCIDRWRASYHKLGNHLVGEGKLPESNLIFFLTHYEICQLVSARSPKLIKKAIARKRIHPQMDNFKFPERNIGYPQPLQSERVLTEVSSTSAQIKGTPVCNGVIKGTARVIKHLSEANQIQANDILITYCTDIGWSPYFPLLSGIATEIGGILSHGAVVAREFGLPCIVGARDATLLCKSGDTVLLNGSTGILELIKE